MKKAVDTFSSDSFLSLSSRLEPGPGFEDPWNRSTIRSSRAAATRSITGRFRSSTMSTASFGKRYCKTGACGAARCPRVRVPALTPPSAGARRIGPAAFTLTCRGSQPPYRAAADTGYRPSKTRVRTDFREMRSCEPHGPGASPTNQIAGLARSPQRSLAKMLAARSKISSDAAASAA